VVFHEIFKNAAKNMAPIIEFLTANDPLLNTLCNFETLLKVAFYAVIYQNILVKETLGVIDRNGPKLPTIIHSNYDSSSDDSLAAGQRIEYDRGVFHNYFSVSEGELSQ